MRCFFHFHLIAVILLKIHFTEKVTSKDDLEGIFFAAATNFGTKTLLLVTQIRIALLLLE